MARRMDILWTSFFDRFHITSPGQFLPGSHMIIPFSGNYHVPDSINGCSSSCPSLVDPRTAKKRRTERTIHARDAADGLQKAQGRFHPDEFWLQMSAKKVFYCLQLVPPALLRSPPPRTLRSSG